MDASKEKFEEVVEKLKAERDELRVKAHLGSMEAKEEWARLEEKWHRLESRLGQAKDEITETSKGLGEGLEVVVDELKAAYARIRGRLNDE